MCISPQVNLIDLPTDKEFLRDSVFYRIFKDIIVMDTYKHASKFWNSLVELPDDLALAEMPTIYTLDGTRIKSDGTLQLRKEGVNTADLSYAFGEMSPLQLEEYDTVKRSTFVQLVTL